MLEGPPLLYKFTGGLSHTAVAKFRYNYNVYHCLFEIVLRYPEVKHFSEAA